MERKDHLAHYDALMYEGDYSFGEVNEPRFVEEYTQWMHQQAHAISLSPSTPEDKELLEQHEQNLLGAGAASEFRV